MPQHWTAERALGLRTRCLPWSQAHALPVPASQRLPQLSHLHTQQRRPSGLLWGPPHPQGEPSFCSRDCGGCTWGPACSPPGCTPSALLAAGVEKGEDRGPKPQEGPGGGSRGSTMTSPACPPCVLRAGWQEMASSEGATLRHDEEAHSDAAWPSAPPRAAVVPALPNRL